MSSLPSRNFKILHPKSESGGKAIDASALYDFIESFVARSIVDVALLAPWNVSPYFKSHISNIYRDRVFFIDPTAVIRKVQIYLGPVFKETKSHFNGSQLLYIKPDDVAKDPTSYLFKVAKGLFRFLLAVEHNLQLDLERATLQESVMNLRTLMGNTEARYKLAILEGVLSSYVDVEQPSLQVQRTSSNEMLDFFTDLVNEDLYLALSNEVNKLNVANIRERALLRAGKLVKDIVRLKRFKGILTYGVKLGAALLNIPELEVQSLYASGSAPLICDFSPERKDAIRAWAAREPGVVPYVDLGKEASVGSSEKIDPEKAGGGFTAKFSYEGEEYDEFIADVLGFHGNEDGESTRLTVS